MGLLTGSTGLIGTGLGGIALDKAIQRDADLEPSQSFNLLVDDPLSFTEARQVVVSSRLISILSAVAAPLCMCTFIFPGSVNFFVFLGLAQFIIFITLSPVNSALLWVLPLSERPLGIAFTTLCIHILGDAISPAIIGEIKEATGSWNRSLLLGCLPLVLTVFLWLLAWRSASKNVGRLKIVL